MTPPHPPPPPPCLRVVGQVLVQVGEGVGVLGQAVVDDAQPVARRHLPAGRPGAAGGAEGRLKGVLGVLGVVVGGGTSRAARAAWQGGRVAEMLGARRLWAGACLPTRLPGCTTMAPFAFVPMRGRTRQAQPPPQPQPPSQRA